MAVPAPLDLTALTTLVGNMTDTEASAATALEAFFAAAEANKSNPAAIQALVDQGRASVDKLAAAVAATTGDVIPPA